MLKLNCHAYKWQVLELNISTDHLHHGNLRYAMWTGFKTLEDKMYPISEVVVAEVR